MSGLDDLRTLVFVDTVFTEGQARGVAVSHQFEERLFRSWTDCFVRVRLWFLQLLYHLLLVLDVLL